jgi:hypothetical protein
MAMIASSKCCWDGDCYCDQFFSSSITSWSVGWPWIFVTVSFWSSFLVSALSPIFFSFALALGFAPTFGLDIHGGQDDSILSAIQAK